MATYAYADVHGQIKPLLQRIQETGLPSKVDVEWLASVGFKKSTDRSLNRVLKQIGFVDGSSVPSLRWRRYRDRQAAPRVLAEGIHDGYSGLFKIYPHAHQQAEEDLRNFFASNTKAGDEARRRMVRTFQMLCSLADFSQADDPSQEDVDRPQPETSKPVAQPGAEDGVSRSKVSLHIDLQIHISPEADAEQIDQIFASIAKHLYEK